MLAVACVVSAGTVLLVAVLIAVYNRQARLWLAELAAQRNETDRSRRASVTGGR